VSNFSFSFFNQWKNLLKNNPSSVGRVSLRWPCHYSQPKRVIEGMPFLGGYVFAIWANRAFSLVRFFFATEKETNKHQQ